MYSKIGKQIGQLVSKKQLAYGDSFGKAGQVLKILYPKGIPIDKIDDVLTITRIIDKIFRIANKKDAFDEDPYADIVGYGLLAVVKNKNKKRKK